MDVKSIALTVLGKTLQSRGYRFVAVTPATHCRVLYRPPPPTTVGIDLPKPQIKSGLRSYSSER